MNLKRKKETIKKFEQTEELKRNYASVCEERNILREKLFALEKEHKNALMEIARLNRALQRKEG
ncbi:hypothetical protein [Eubacterium oxidoreducens]|uniref:Uncharacterized protein n=1 Tax=Eubacterium oxidoreducens TaxID=1732 RepID=A0A1G6C3R6_EUBOX|nr:hypothetical protein [Eubacterium oxidoreducens]SDB27474.1 hypothetical protein SAMN02910417_02029 [Eubacterium oxidoreducens]